MCDENLGVIEMGEHDWNVFELVDTESGADFEVVFGSIVHDGSWGQVLTRDLMERLLDHLEVSRDQRLLSGGHLHAGPFW